MTELRFECTRCGACCRRPGVVVVEPDELVRIAAFLGEPVTQVAAHAHLTPEDGRWSLKLDGAPCPFLLDDQCSIHEIKPRQCQTYPFWPEIVGDDGAWLAEGAYCPGIGQGPAWSAAKVQAMLELLGE